MKTLFIVVVVAIMAQPVAAAMPETMSYQGVLRDAGGVPVADGTYSVTFRLWDADTGGTEHWFETLDVTTQGGVFDTIIGKTSHLWMSFDESYWLGMEIEGEPELVPRTELTAAPYSLRARYADLELPYHDSILDSGPAFWVENTDGSAIVAYSGLGVGPGTAAVRGQYTPGTILGALAYVDDDFEPWGLYTNDNAYVAGTLTLPDGAASGRVLTSDADGDASWQPASEFTLPYSDTLSSAYPAFYIQNHGPAIVGRGGHYASGNWAGVRGEYYDGSYWGALGHIDFDLEPWGVYTPNRAYFGGEAHLEGGIQLPTGATSGHILTSDAIGNGTWHAPLLWRPLVDRAVLHAGEHGHESCGEVRRCDGGRYRRDRHGQCVRTRALARLLEPLREDRWRHIEFQERHRHRCVERQRRHRPDAGRETARRRQSPRGGREADDGGHERVSARL